MIFRSMGIKKQLQATVSQDLTDTADYHRADLHRLAIERQRGRDLPTSPVGYIFTPRRARAQTGSSWGVPILEEETGRQTHFVQSKNQQKNSQFYLAGYPTVHRTPQKIWGNNEDFRN